MDRSLIAAQGKALALLATLLDRAGIVSASEFGRMMSAFSEMEDNADQAAILASWADTIREVNELKD